MLVWVQTLSYPLQSKSTEGDGSTSKHVNSLWSLLMVPRHKHRKCLLLSYFLWKGREIKGPITTHNLINWLWWAASLVALRHSSSSEEEEKGVFPGVQLPAHTAAFAQWPSLALDVPECFLPVVTVYKFLCHFLYFWELFWKARVLLNAAGGKRALWG